MKACPYRGSPADPARRLLNLGPVSAGWLAEVGIETRGDLERVGPVEAYRRVKAARPREVTLVMLWALAGALVEIDYRALPPGLKERLLRQLNDPQPPPPASGLKPPDR